VAKRGLGRSNVNADINVTPMADIILVLLIIFMITTPLLQTGITVNLPRRRIHSTHRKPTAKTRSSWR
jgi:biopolymer transport protein TolR